MTKTRKRTETLVHVRWMIRRDMEEVLHIAADCALPWGQEDFLHALRQRNCIGMIAEVKDVVTGFMVYELNSGFFTLLNFAVDPHWWERGVGTAMMNKLTSKLGEHRRTRIECVVPERSVALQCWLRGRGFKATKVLRGHFEIEDGFAMEYRL